MPPSAAIAGQIAEYDKNRVTSADAMNDALKQYGVPEIRQTVAGLRTTLANTTNAYNAVDPSVTGRTQGSLVTEAQRTKQVSNERAPIAGQISDQGRALGDQTTALNDALGQATTLATNRVNDYNTGRKALQDQYDTSYTVEQNTAKQEAERQAAARDQSNQDRAYQLQVQASRQKGSAAPNPAELKSQVAQHVGSGLASSVGKDGKVSNETWSAALNDAVSAGFTVREFWQKYGQYVNTKYKDKYAGYGQR